MNKNFEFYAMEVHIGREIERKFQESGLKISEFAKRLNTGTRNVYSIFERTDISSSQLKKISEVLNYNFFALYAESLPMSSVVQDLNLTYESREKLRVVVELDGQDETLQKWVKKLTAINQVI
jgi:transcriptional regulator with XRE-family HTH domain